MGGTGPQIPALVDREREMERIGQALEAAVRGKGSLLLVRGEAGVGKSRLLQAAAGKASDRAFEVAWGNALLESVSPYQLWREALDGLHLTSSLEEHRPPMLMAVWLLDAKGEVVAEAEREGIERHSIDHLKITARGTSAEDYDVVSRDVGPWRLITFRMAAERVAAVLKGRETEILLADLRDVAGRVQDTRTPEALSDIITSGKYDGIDHARGNPQAVQSLLFEEAALGLAHRAVLKPILLVLDDLQWADPSSLALLHYAVRNGRQSRMLVLGACRTEAGVLRPHLQAALKRMEGEGLLQEFDLDGLTSVHTRELARAFVGPHALPDSFLERLWAETEGNPLFVREVLLGLELDGTIRLKGAVKRLTVELETLAIPRRVREVIHARLDRLPAEDRELLNVASTCGSRFNAALVAKVAGKAEARVLNSLRAIAQVHGLLQPTGTAFAFDHPAIQEVLYEFLPEDARRTYHREAAEWLDLMGAPAGDIGEHYYRARDPRAVEWLVVASREARDRYANELAIHLYGKALDLVTSGPERQDLLDERGAICELIGDYDGALAGYTGAFDLARTREMRGELLSKVMQVHRLRKDYTEALKVGQVALTAVGGTTSREEGIVLARIGAVHGDRGSYSAALDFYSRSLTILEARDDQRGVGMCLSGMGNAYHQLSCYQDALSCLGRGLQVYEQLHDEEHVGIQLHTIGVTYYDQGNYRTAFEFFQRSIQIHERLGALPRLARDLKRLSELYGGRGERDKAVSLLERACAIHERLGEVSGVMECRGDACFMRGDFNQAITHFQTGLRRAEEVGSSSAIADWTLRLAQAFHKLERYDEEIRYLQLCLQVSQECGRLWSAALAASDLVEAYRAQTDLEMALRQCPLAHRLAKASGSIECTIAAERVAALVNRDLRHWDMASRHFAVWARQATQAAGELGLGVWHHEFAVMCQWRGDVPAARDHFGQAVATFRALGMKQEMNAARAAMRALETAVPQA